MMDRSIFKKNDSQLAWRVIDGEVAIIPLDAKESKDSMIILNPTAARIWELINGKNTGGAIANKLLSEYEVGLPEAQQEVKKLITFLLRKKLILRS